MTSSPAGSNVDRAHPRVIRGRYHVLFRLGTGGMAAVYVARDAQAAGGAALVAVKLLHAHLVTEADFERDFMREAAIASRIQHPNVVGVGESGTEAGTPYLLMEYVRGDTLGTLQKRTLERGGAVPVPVVLRIVVDVLHGLHAAHELRAADGTPSALVHRDVSPQNVLVDTDGVAKLTDFGVARIAERTAFTAAGLVKGKLRYMSPEQVVGKELDRRTDLWAVGVMLWELLACRRLYEGDDGNVVFQLVAGKVPPLAGVRPDLPAALIGLFDVALARDLDQRFESAAAFAAALEALGLAGTRADVAAYLGTTLRDVLDERESNLRRTHDEGSDGTLDVPDQTGTRTIVTAHGEKRRSRGFLVGGIVVALGLAAVGVVARRPVATDLATAPLVASSAAPSPELPALEPWALPSDADRVVTVVSSVPLAALERTRAGVRSALAIPRGSQRVDVPNGVRGDVLTGTAVDGRHAEAVVADDAALILAFSGAAPAKPGHAAKKAKDGLHRQFP